MIGCGRMMEQFSTYTITGKKREVFLRHLLTKFDKCATLPYVYWVKSLTKQSAIF